MAWYGNRRSGQPRVGARAVVVGLGIAVVGALAIQTSSTVRSGIDACTPFHGRNDCQSGRFRVWTGRMVAWLRPQPGRRGADRKARRRSARPASLEGPRRDDGAPHGAIRKAARSRRRNTGAGGDGPRRRRRTAPSPPPRSPMPARPTACAKALPRSTSTVSSAASCASANTRPAFCC